ncbi:hypothetical protein KKE06_01860 [Candidatus Micrarchaeota archaeon]|nr:hypothetical protein [Candidatus Micrarchaeota archaeon]MBU1930669.1 hypothetical protein [Candidatus Micrarchaeota archaeon]
MPRIVRKPGSQVRKFRGRIRTRKGGRILGTIRSYPYGKRTRRMDAKKVGKRVAHLEKEIKRISDRRGWSPSGLIAIANSLRAKKRALIGKKRSKTPEVKQKLPLLNLLVARHSLGKRWHPVIQEMEQERMIKLSPGMNLRAELARALRRINPKVAGAVLKGEAVSFPHRGRVSFEVFLRRLTTSRRKDRKVEQEPRWTMKW